MLLRHAADNPVKVRLANPILVWAGCCGQGSWTIPGRILDFLSHMASCARQRPGTGLSLAQGQSSLQSLQLLYSTLLKV